MATVYLATDEKLGRSVAIKILHAHMENNPELRQRFNHEAQAISGLDHPNIVKIYDFSGAESSKLWFVTEIVKGANLADVLAKSPNKVLHPIVAACIVRESCKALAHAHSFGIVHRDIKPENIMVTYDGILKLMDFGIAKIQQRGAVTVTGTFMGSPSYMSPEQIRGRNIDHRCDIYSLSVLFYELVTGRLPFIGHSTHDVIVKIMEGQLTPPVVFNPRLSETLNQLICSGLARNPDARPSSALEMEKFIQNFLMAQNFDESHVELQRYFKNPEVYVEKFLTPNFSPGNLPDTVRRHNENALNHPQIPKTARLDPMTMVLAQREAVFRRSKIKAPNPVQIAEQMAERGIRRDRVIPPIAVPIPVRRAPSIAPRIPMRAQPLPVPVIVNIGHQQLPAPRQVAPLPPKPRYSFPRVPKRIRQNRVEVYSYHSDRSSVFGFAAFVVFLIVFAGIIFEIFKNYSDRKNEIKNLHSNAKHERKIPQEHSVKELKPKESLEHENPDVEEKISAQVPAEKPVRSAVVKPKMSDYKPVIIDSKKVDKKPEPKILDDKSDQKSDQRPTMATKKPVELKGDAFFGISSQPASEIFWRGKKLGTTIDSGLGSGWIKLPIGTHKIELIRAGYESRTVEVVLKPHAHLVIPQVTLTQSTKIKFSLTVISNKFPAIVTVSSGGKKERATLTSSQKTFSLDSGSYDVAVEYRGDKQARTINLSGQNTQVTFNAIFKDATKENKDIQPKGDMP